MSTTARTTSEAECTHVLVKVTRRLEEARALDPVVAAVKPVARALIASPRRRWLLQGEWLGHAIHPILTDLPLGFWTSATVLDLVGGVEARPAARRLIGLGVLSAAPTAITGWAEWGGIDGQRERRVGVVHAVSSATAALTYAASWHARRVGEHERGRNLALAGAVIVAAGGYLGGHLASARKVSSRHPAFD